MTLLLSSGEAREYKYKTYFGACPTRSAGALTLKLIKEYETDYSLRDVKELISREKLEEKYFLESYKISKNPIEKKLFLSFECPKPLLKVSAIEEAKIPARDFILGSNGNLIDPIYETLLRNEKKIESVLPNLSIPFHQLTEQNRKVLSQMVLQLGDMYQSVLSELIVDSESELTMIMSLQGRPISIFFGSTEWEFKVKKLKQIIEFFNKKNRYPSIINLTNHKKVVVKFSDKS